MYSGVYSKLVAFLERFGEKGLLVLKVAYDVSQDPNVDHRLGDFSFKHLVLKLASMGFNYNPVNLLRVLEKEYGVIEKSYTSSNQTWWRFTDLEAVRKVLSEHYNVPIDDPKIRALYIKFKSLEPIAKLDWLKKLLAKERLTSSDKEAFKSFVFNELDKIVALLNEMENYEEVFQGEIAILKEILVLADVASNKLEKSSRTAQPREVSLTTLKQASRGSTY